MSRSFACAVIATCALSLASCRGPAEPVRRASDGPGGGRRDSSAVADGESVRAAAMVDGEPIDRNEVWASLAESAGAEALREVVLDRGLRRELERRSLSVGAAQTEAERSFLLESLATDPQTAARYVVELRRREGLGPTRFASLLWRNAAMRLLVRESATVSPEAVLTAYDMAAGPKRQVRLIAVSTLADADQILLLIRNGSSFADLAVNRSNDSSAVRGGLLEPFSRRDPSYPESLRVATFALAPGGVSEPILLPQGYVVLSLVREIPATGETLEAMRPRLELAVRQTQERLLMDQFAQRLLRESRVTVFDDALNSSWNAAQSAGGANAIR